MSRYSLWNPFLVSAFHDPRTFKDDDGGSDNGGGGGGNNNNNNNTQTNQDRINEIYASSDNPWETNGDELNALVNDRDGTYTGGATTTTSTTTTSSSSDKDDGPKLSATAAAKVGTVAQDEKGDWYAVVQNPNSNTLGRDYSIDPKDDSKGPTFGANVSDNIETLFPDEVAAAGGSSEFQGSITDIFKDTDVPSAGFDAATNTYTYEPAATQTFDEAFAENRAAGNETFTYNGKLYTTELAAEPAVAQPGDLAIPEVTTTTLDGTPVLTVDQINALATEAIDAAPDYTFTPTGGPGTFAPGALPAGDPDALDPRGDQIVSPTGTGIGVTPASVGANDQTEALLNLTAGIGAGNVGLDEAIATLNLIEGNTLTDDDITALMPPTGGGETVGGFTEAGLADEVAKYTGSAATGSDSEPSTLQNFGNVFGIGATDYLPALAATGAEQLVSIPLNTGQDLGLIGDRVLNPDYKLQSAGIDDRSGLDRFADETYAFSTGDYNVGQTGGPLTLTVPMAQTSLESVLDDYAAGQYQSMADKISRLPDDVKSALAAEVVSIPDKFGYKEGQVDPGFAAPLGEDPNALALSQTSLDPTALLYQTALTAPSAVATIATGLVNPGAGAVLGATLAGGEAQTQANREME